MDVGDKVTFAIGAKRRIKATRRITDISDSFVTVNYRGWRKFMVLRFEIEKHHPQEKASV